MNQKVVMVTATAVMVVAGVAYLLFLAFTWSQLQHDRSARYSKVDELIDKVSLVKEKPAAEQG